MDPRRPEDTVAAGQTPTSSIVLQKGAVITGKVLVRKATSNGRARDGLRRFTPPGCSGLSSIDPWPMQSPQQTNDIGSTRQRCPPGEHPRCQSRARADGPGMPRRPATAAAHRHDHDVLSGDSDQAGAQSAGRGGRGSFQYVFVLQSAPAYRVSGSSSTKTVPIARHGDAAGPAGRMIFMGRRNADGRRCRFSIGDVTSASASTHR